jgi:hypothetical protein
MSPFPAGVSVRGHDRAPAAVPQEGTAPPGAALSLAIPSPMEDPMCWEMDYHWFAEQQQAQEREQEKLKQKQAQRAAAIDKLLSEAKTEVADETPPVKETVPAK